jgi:hypothetical protein
MAANRYVKAVFKTAEIAKINKEIGELETEKRQMIAKNKRNYKAGKKSDKDFTGRGMDGVPRTKSANLSAGQKRNKARLEEVQAIARSLKAKNPRLSHAQAVSKAWKQM